MYPYLRFARALRGAHRLPLLGPFDTHVSHHICWPWDLDPWAELNNGRTLTLYDLGRVPLVIRVGLAEAVRREGWGFAVAGASVRYRRRVRAFERFTMTSRLLGWDARFMYLEQAMWRGADCTSAMLLRSACTARGAGGIIPPARVGALLGVNASPPLPDWVEAWIAADARRPWPPAASPAARPAAAGQRPPPSA